MPLLDILFETKGRRLVNTIQEIRKIMRSDAPEYDRMRDSLSIVRAFMRTEGCAAYLFINGNLADVRTFYVGEPSPIQNYWQFYTKRMEPAAIEAARTGDTQNFRTATTFHRPGKNSDFGGFTGVPIQSPDGIVGVLAVLGERPPLASGELQYLWELASAMVPIRPMEAHYPSQSGRRPPPAEASLTARASVDDVIYCLQNNNENISAHIATLKTVLTEYILEMDNRKPNDSQAADDWCSERNAILDLFAHVDSLSKLAVQLREPQSKVDMQAIAATVTSEIDATGKKVRSWWECHERTIKNQIWKGMPNVFKVALITSAAVVGAQFGVGFLTGTAAVYFLGGDSALGAISAALRSKR